MANNDSTKIKELLETIKQKVDKFEAGQTNQSAQIATIRDQINTIGGQLSVINSKLDAHSGSLIEIEATLKGYGDMYKINGHNIKRLNKRLQKVERSLDIQSPQELFIPN